MRKKERSLCVITLIIKKKKKVGNKRKKEKHGNPEDEAQPLRKDKKKGKRDQC